MSNQIDEPQVQQKIEFASRRVDNLKSFFRQIAWMGLENEFGGDEFFRKMLGPPLADPFTLDFSSDPITSCSCPEKKLKKLYNYIDHELMRYAQSNIRSLYIYADLLGKAVHILVSNEEGIDCEKIDGYCSPHKVRFNRHVNLALHFVLGSCKDVIDGEETAEGFEKFRALLEDLKKIKIKAKNIMFKELADIFPNFPDVVLDKILGYVITANYEEIDFVKYVENRKVVGFSKSFGNYDSKILLEKLESGLTEMVHAFKYAYTHNESSMYQRISKRLGQEIEENNFTTFPSLWRSVKSLFEEI